MDCKNTQNILIDFIEGNIPDDTKVQIEEHLLTCSQCRKEHKQTHQLIEELSVLEDETPNVQLKQDFYTMLEQEKERMTEAPINKKPFSEDYLFVWKYIKYAASAIMLLGFGFLVGRNIQIQSMQNSEIAALRSELYSMQQTATTASLSMPTASQRLKAVNTLNEQVKVDMKTVALLINTFKTDENINVRMAAANALAKYKQSTEVRDAFLEVLEKEENAAMQITLINLLTQMQEKRAKESFEKIVNNEQAMPVVKEQAKEGLKVFI
jgi:hypothetical protein